VRRSLALAVAVALLPACALAHVGMDELEGRARADVAERPTSADAHLELARVLQEARQWDAALAAIEDAAARGGDPDVVGARKASVYLDAGFPRMAMIELDRVLARRPAAYDLLHERGRAWLALGDADAAARDFGTAIAKGSRPTPEQVLARRDALVSIGKKREALGALDEGMRRVGPVVSLTMPAIDLELELGRPEAALVRLDALARTGAPNPLWIARRGDILERAGRGRDARAEYAKALALLDARPQGRRARALDDLRQRLTTALAPDDRQGEMR
jgi:predicted negative regulator of RcsB-dependent stress response